MVSGNRAFVAPLDMCPESSANPTVATTMRTLRPSPRTTRTLSVGIIGAPPQMVAYCRWVDHTAATHGARSGLGSGRILGTVQEMRSMPAGRGADLAAEIAETLHLLFSAVCRRLPDLASMSAILLDSLGTVLNLLLQLAEMRPQFGPIGVDLPYARTLRLPRLLGCVTGLVALASCLPPLFVAEGPPSPIATVGQIEELDNGPIGTNWTTQLFNPVVLKVAQLPAG
jgi:hypothetical protein